jgi:hypothetical protein
MVKDFQKKAYGTQEARMSQTSTVPDEADGSELVRLAEKLVQRLGIEEALRVCRENSWHGVVRMIKGRRNDGIHA